MEGELEVGTKKREALTEFNKTQILNAAKIRFEQKGIQLTTVDEIAKEADMSKSTLYVYFKSKDEILYHLIYAEFQKMKENMEKCKKESTSFKDAYYAICHMMVAYQKQSPVFFECLLNRIEVSRKQMEDMPVLKQIYAVGEQVNDIIAELLETGMKQGKVKKDIPLIPTVLFMWSSISEAVRFANEKSDYLKTRLSMKQEEYLEYSFALILHAIEE